MNTKLIALIRAKFLAKLATKTGWGKNDVMTTYDQCVNEALLELMDEAQ
jgi:hypothetical protein